MAFLLSACKELALPGHQHGQHTQLGTHNFGTCLHCAIRHSNDKENIKCLSMKHSKWNCGSSKLACLGTAGGPTMAAPSLARRAAEHWGAARCAPQPCAQEKLNPPLPLPRWVHAELLPSREMSMESRHPQSRDADDLTWELTWELIWEPAAPSATGSSAPSQSSGMDLSQRSPWGGHPSWAVYQWVH